MTTSPAGVNARRPAIYLAVGAVLALGAALLSGGAATGEPGPQAAGPAAGAPAQPAACTEGVRESLRPRDPLPAPGAMPAGSTMAAIAARGRLIAGVDQGKFLAGYRDPLDSTLKGSDIDIVRRIAAAIFGDEERVQYVVLNIADRAAALERDQVDVVVNSFTVTCARQRTVEFSAPYLPATQRLLVPLGSGIQEAEDLAGRTVCTSRGSTTEVVLRNLGLQVETLTGIPDCVLEMQRGRVAAVSSDDVILAGLAAQDPNTRVVGRALDTSARYAVGMRPDEPDLVRFVNGVLEAARADGSLAANFRYWYTGRLDTVPQPLPPVYRD
jgi:polar amino acid transport system substrate-binding protein